LEFVFEEPKKDQRSGLRSRRSSHTRSFYNDKLQEPTEYRSTPSNYGHIDMTPVAPKRKKKVTQKVKYLNSVKKKKRKKTKSSGFEFSWYKFSWMIIAALTLRLVFMERGVIDYYNTKDHITQKIHELELLEQENRELVKEIHEIKVNPVYQKKLAREHLGVIAKDEYLVLFASDN
jgi:cell division protein FtsB